MVKLACTGPESERHVVGILHARWLGPASATARIPTRARQTLPQPLRAWIETEHDVEVVPDVVPTEEAPPQFFDPMLKQFLSILLRNNREMVNHLFDEGKT
ncbi:MAG: hypothetical protein K8U57_11845 [Planctomycetes bacterium]|nr:hypothetical protein [Planctomycetota bacterium]